jgi:hypothetical protein
MGKCQKRLTCSEYNFPSFTLSAAALVSASSGNRARDDCNRATGCRKRLCKDTPQAAPASGHDRHMTAQIDRACHYPLASPCALGVAGLSHRRDICDYRPQRHWFNYPGGSREIRG